MKFFALLVVLLLQKLPNQGVHHGLDRAYRAFHRWSAQIWKSHLGATAPFLTAVIFWLLTIWLVLWWLDGWLAGVPALLVNLAVLYYALGRRNEQKWIQRYMIAWRQGDHQAAYYYAEELLERPCNEESATQVHAQVLAKLTYLAFDRLFMVIFWFLLLGPLGALLVRLSERALYHARQAYQDVDPAIEHFHFLLEWPASRLLGLTFALAGRPLLGLRQWSRDLFKVQLESETFLNRQLITACGHLSEAAACYQQRPEMMTPEADQELALLKEQLWRALIIWVAVFALSVILWS
ncbi:regulatory signaling modulator protein AmpE [Marinospirillum sp. MEB164]|uniref:Regulatory signaling modulator protein AmpE n=1 Tax=Marinospirillum alkalitolerans TaxID=3123374 RepID=A0ABW8PU94_9GAMM